MIVDNLTANTFVLDRGVVLLPNETGVTVADELYTTSSGLNEQLDAMEEHDFISITDKPSDPFPTTTIQPPASISGSNPESVPFTIVAAEGQNWNIFDLFLSPDSLANGVPDFGVQADGFVTLIANRIEANPSGRFDACQLLVSNQVSTGSVTTQIQGIAGQTGDLLRVYDKDSVLVMKITAGGVIHTKNAILVDL